MKRIAIVAVLLLVAAPCFAQKVQIDYDQGYDFSKIKTFSWYKTEETSLAQQSPLTHSRVVNGIEHYLSEGGLIEVESDPDVYVTYHTSSQEEVSFNTTSFGYGYPGSWYWGGGWGGMGGMGMGGMGMGTSTTSVNTYETGTLIIDIWDAKKKEMVWRGSMSATIPAKPQKLDKKIDSGLRKLVEKWRKMYQGG